MRIKKNLLKISPYFAAILAGLLFCSIGLRLSESIKGLFWSISAAFFAIPLIYLFYQVAQNLSRRRLDKEIFDYAKMRVDKEILSIVNQLHKIVYSLEERDFSLSGIREFLSLGEHELKEVLSKNKYLGFQIFKKWEASEEKLNKALESSYMLKSLENEQIIAIVSIIKGLRYLEDIQKDVELYVKTGKKATSYRTSIGSELSKENILFPERYLLLKDIEDDKLLVADFGDFARYNEEKLLQIFTVNSKYLFIYSDAIYSLMSGIKHWVDLTGGEFIIDTKMFRVEHKLPNASR